MAEVSRNEIVAEVSKIEITETKSVATQTDQRKGHISLAIRFHIILEMPFSDAAKYQPTQVFKICKKLKWLGMHGPSFNSIDYNPTDVKCLRAEYYRLLHFHGYLTSINIERLKQQFNIQSGKWLFLVPSSDVDSVWDSIVNAIAENEFDGFSNYARVSTKSIGGLHAICVYTKNQLVNEIINLEANIRKLGVKAILYYKPDIYTFCGIHCHNGNFIRPVTFRSEFRPTGADNPTVVKTQFNVRTKVNL